MTRREIGRLVEAHDAIWLAWWPTLRALPHSLAHHRLPGSYPTVFALLRHMVESEIYWQDRLEGRAEHDTPSRWKTMRQLERAWRTLRKRRESWIARADLRRRVQFQAAGGYTGSVSISECLIHLTTHTHFHRGQLVTQCRQVAVEPPSRHLLGSFFGEY
jgi:uncharacterized damage-inducible protein DinB